MQQETDNGEPQDRQMEQPEENKHVELRPEDKDPKAQSAEPDIQSFM